MLKHIHLENFRSHQKFDLDLKKITILIGPNGAGKSNVLEAISVLSSCRSFREDDKKNLINSECNFSRILGDELEVFIQRDPALMRAKERGVFKKQSSFIGLLKSVVFSPETMSLATGSPKIRRKFLDLMISQKDRDYLSALITYEKIRTQRNFLLQRVRDRQSAEDELDFWDKELIREGEVIAGKRAEAIDFLNCCVGDTYRNISGTPADDLTVCYQGTDNMEESIGENRQKEIWQGRTLYGPHRDDIIIYLNNSAAASFASRGEIRSAVLALKLGELSFLGGENEDRPILLLDDIFSEFDEMRRSHLGKLIGDYQAVITTTDNDHLSGWPVEDASIVSLS